MVSVCDSREPHQQPQSIASQLVAMGWKMEALQCGDYQLDCGLEVNPIVERKRIDNFIADMKDGTLMRQTTALCEATPFPILIREGSVYLKPPQNLALRDWPEITLEMLRNQEHRLMRMGLALERTNDVSDTIRRLQELVRHYKQPYSESITRALRQMPGDYRLANLHLIPGLGQVKAQAILTVFPTLRAVANASVQELTDCPGIGYKLAKKLFAWFNS